MQGTNLERVTTEQAARELGMCTLTLQTLMDQGNLPIGEVIRRKTRNTYIIYRNKLDDYKENRSELMKVISGMGTEMEGFLKAVCLKMLKEEGGGHAGKAL